VVYWLVFFSIVIHGLSIPILNCLYKWFRVPTIKDHPVEIILLSENEPVPNNSVVDRRGHSIVLNNRFSCASGHRPHSDDPNHQEPDTIMLRRSGDTEYTGSLERDSTKASSQELERTMTARNVV
jgi:hypothetical protein